MSEMHTYRITFVGVGCPTGIADVKAFTAPDAVAQWREVSIFGSRRVLAIEPLPDSPAVPDERAEAQRPVKSIAYANAQLDEMAAQLREAHTDRDEWKALAERYLSERNDARAEAERQRSLKTEAPLEGTARAATPKDRADALEAALRERTAERDTLTRERDQLAHDAIGLRRGRDSLAAELREAREKAETEAIWNERFVEAITGAGPDGKTHFGVWVQRAKETREERDRLGRAVLASDGDCMRLTAERDALACAAVGQDPRLGVSMVDVERVVRDLGDLRERAQDRLDALKEIARTVWTVEDPAYRAWTHADLVGAVRNQTVERDDARRQRDSAIKREEELAAKVTSSKEALAARESTLTSVLEHRDALQKRIDAARKWLSGCTWVAPPTGLISILEGREP